MKFRTVATGGTFDHLHRGHEALLSKSFEAGEKVVIGVTSDAFAQREGKSPDQTFAERVARLREYLDGRYPGREYAITKLEDHFGPGIASAEVDAIVVSRETASKVSIANEVRASEGFLPLQVVVVDFVLDEDGKPISSTRIRQGEIDREGRRQHR
ncbi:MAG: pantetheine-phosphate adenylyltransferase [Nitrososphaerales archaeon]|nr:pantetheine-phosphate adenylyltransferase [Nitrososphaerales archaeon]